LRDSSVGRQWSVPWCRSSPECRSTEAMPAAVEGARHPEADVRKSAALLRLSRLETGRPGVFQGAL
jgi:hypothetical protein